MPHQERKVADPVVNGGAVAVAALVSSAASAAPSPRVAPTTDAMPEPAARASRSSRVRSLSFIGLAIMFVAAMVPDSPSCCSR